MAKSSTSRAAPKRAGARKSAAAAGGSIEQQAAEALAALQRASTQRDRDNMKRFGIAAPKFYGVSMANIQVLAKRIGRSHELAAALWDSGWYEARMLCAFVDEPERVSVAQMDRWCRDFDNWGICDTLCFKLFDQVPQAWGRVASWSEKRGEFQKRAAFALLACLAAHDKQAADARFLEGLKLIERHAGDERNFVKKGVNWALRCIGRRNPALRLAAVAVSRRLSSSEDAAARWVGKDALRELTKPAVVLQTARKVRASMRKSAP